MRGSQERLRGSLRARARRCARSRYGKITIKNGGVYGENGALIGTGIPLLKMCANFMKWTGLSPAEALQTVTGNPQKLLKDKTGRIKPGFFADLIAVDDKLKLHRVWAEGEEVEC